MCDQTEVSYLEDDVVWVKIGPIWWPGVVKDLEKDDEGKAILAGLKKKPIAVVKFFQEDNYEFVKNLDQIYHYSCRRKDEFIKKGLDKFRSGAPHMKKFPADVTTAESLTNGDINIINDPKFFPEKKESYSEIFGSGKKKSKKDSESSPRSRIRTPASVSPYRPITHQRFINKVLHGESDHRVKTLIQSNSGSEDSASRNPYKCHICKFETSRVNVIVAHHRLSHSSKNSIDWTGSDSKLVRRKPLYKSRKIKSKKLFETSKEDFSDDEVTNVKKKSPKNKNSKEKVKSGEKIKSEGGSQFPSKRKSKEDVSNGAESKKPRFTDVLLADWNEDEEEDKKEDEKCVADSKTKTEDGEAKEENASASVDSTEPSEPVETRKNQSEKMSCFDFDEEEEGFIGMSNANTYGRKIPRVIPVKDKTELGMDLEIEELFKRKNDAELDSTNEEVSDNLKDEDNKDVSMSASEANENDTEQDVKEKPAAKRGRRKASKTIKEEVPKIIPEDSLALRRTRRPGAKKSYLNEVIERIEDDDDIKPKSNEINEQVNAETQNSSKKSETSKAAKEETGSSSRRKQDFKHQIDSDREEMVYSDIVRNEQKPKMAAEEKKKTKSLNKESQREEDLTAQIDNLLEETKLPDLPEISESEKAENSRKAEESKSANTTNFSFDYMPNESTGKKTSKTRAEVKSISRMFSDSIPNTENSAEVGEESQNTSQIEDVKDLKEEKEPVDGGQNKTIQIANLKFSQTSTNSQKKGSIILSTLPKSESGQVKVLPLMKQANSPKDCIVLPTGKKIDIKKPGVDDVEQKPEGEGSPRPKNIKTIKVKSDSLPSSLITAGKLKGQTIIHQKGGKYVIVTQPPQAGRPRTASGKVQSGGKVMILTNQLGEQKIITSGLQQTKFKTVDGQKVLATGDSGVDKDTVSSPSTSAGSPSQTQPVIKMVPDGKGGIMKQLTVSPKKVLLGGTKVLVSASGSTFSTGNSVQKIAISGGGTARSAGGDFRLIENYKGSGKTVLIQGSSSPGSGVVLKSSSVVPRQVTKVIQSPQSFPALKKKPKILMRASSGQGEYVMQSASGIESPAYVVKRKGVDGKFSAQKVVRTEIVNQPKVSPSGTGTKTFFLSGQGSNKKGESYIITTNEAVPSKVIRMRQKIKEVDSSAKPAQKVVQKAPEVFAISQNSLLLPGHTSTESETPQIVQIQEQPQQPVLQTQVIAMPGPVGADGNQTYVLVSVDEHGVVQSMDNSVVAYDATAQPDPLFVNSTSTNNVILINPQANEEVTPIFSSSSQDILAEALANTNVLEGNINNEMDPVVPSILLPPSIPSSVVQETSITLQKPIMTPLEIPSSVAPDTSCLEPPPLPPTPTEEDVLMEESEISVAGGTAQGQLAESNKKEEIASSEGIQTFLQPENFVADATESSFQVTGFPKDDENQKIFDEQFTAASKSEERGESEAKGREFYDPMELSENTTSEQDEYKELPREEFIIENSQEEQNTNSFQSMPLLNDEPDTSDDAQGSEPIAEQNFEIQKSRIESEQFSKLIREQEPPSSTNNEMLTENNHGASEFEASKYETYHQLYEGKNGESEPKTKEVEEKLAEEGSGNAEGSEEKEPIMVTGNKESQSMPVIADESNVNTYEMDSIYSDVISHKRFQEETEVSSTTDEYASKDVAN